MWSAAIHRRFRQPIHRRVFRLLTQAIRNHGDESPGQSGDESPHSTREGLFSTPNEGFASGYTLRVRVFVA